MSLGIQLKMKVRKHGYRTSAVNYDGKFIENYIEGYQTLYVEGREMLSLEIESEKVNVGVRVSSQRLPERTLTIHFKLEEKNPVEFQRSFNKLMRLLLQGMEDVEIHFNDELDMYLPGRYRLGIIFLAMSIA